MDNRQSILKILQKNKGTWISGEQISSSLEISRTAVWKNISFLREKGYEIGSSSKLGYKFISTGKGIDEYKIKCNLKTRLIGQKSIVVYDTTDSTNREAFKLASQGISEGSIVIAENQTSGKGRLGRSWKSFSGKGIYLSIILRITVFDPGATGIFIAVHAI